MFLSALTSLLVIFVVVVSLAGAGMLMNAQTDRLYKTHQFSTLSLVLLAIYVFVGPISLHLTTVLFVCLSYSLVWILLQVKWGVHFLGAKQRICYAVLYGSAISGMIVAARLLALLRGIELGSVLTLITV